jgi:hypothetical protein
MGETVTILRSEYDHLIEDSQFLKHLHANGVDNWEGYTHPDDDEDEDDWSDDEFDEDDIPF